MTSASTASRLRRALAAALVGGLLQSASAQTSDLAVDAREALRRRDAPLLATLRDRAVAQQHPLAGWIDYWELGNRLDRAQQPELDAFYARWPGSYVEDRLRNDWLLELGKRRDWANLQREFPRFRLNDDREVTCYALTAEHLARDAAAPTAPAFKARALDAWFAPRDADDGCQLLATTMVEAKVFSADDAWRRARLAAEANRLRTARAAAALAAPALQPQVASALDKPALFLNAGATVASRGHAEVATLALIRVAANEPDVAASLMQERWQARLPRDLSAWVWAQIARSSATRLQAEAPAHYRTAWAEAERANPNAVPAWSDDTLAWAVRAALRDTASAPAERWRAVVRAVEQFSPAEQRDSAWRYWRARAQRELAAPGAAGDRLRTQALAELRQLATELHFYGKLAAEDLGQAFVVPYRPAPVTADERTAATRHPGLTRALQLVALGLRNEGVREWNFSLRGMDDRALLAAAERACDAQVWDRCINTSERTREAVDLEQRFPMPFRDDVIAAAKQIGLDPAYVYGLIRQESRFILDARSHVGASGLMQLMPATARWTAKKVGLAYTPDAITDRAVNLKLGTSYLKLVLDDFGGSQAMAAAAYNAGPSRPRRWREGALVEAAVWAENIPFAETRDYVKKVLSNATVYSALLAGQKQAEAPPPPAVVAPAASAPLSAVAASGVASAPGLVPVVYTPPAPPAPPPFVLPSLKARLGAAIGPREQAAPPPDKELP